MVWRRETAWRRLDEHGEERCTFLCSGEGCAVEGIGAIAINGSGMLYEYRIEFDDAWNPRRAEVASRLGTDEFRVLVEQREPGKWFVDGLHAVQFDGCRDVDLSFSASTNTTTIKRLALAVGDQAQSSAVLVNEPELTLDTLEQRYLRRDETTYEYASDAYHARIDVDDEQVVTDYEGRFTSALETVASPTSGG